MPILAAAGHGHHRATASYRKQMAASPMVIPPEYRPTPSSTRVTGMTLLMARATLHQGALLSLDDCGSSVERAATLHPL
jgi:hypothetical protein